MLSINDNQTILKNDILFTNDYSFCNLCKIVQSAYLLCKEKNYSVTYVKISSERKFPDLVPLKLPNWKKTLLFIRAFILIPILALPSYIDRKIFNNRFCLYDSPKRASVLKEIEICNQGISDIEKIDRNPLAKISPSINSNIVDNIDVMVQIFIMAIEGDEAQRKILARVDKNFYSLSNIPSVWNSITIQFGLPISSQEELNKNRNFIIASFNKLKSSYNKICGIIENKALMQTLKTFIVNDQINKSSSSAWAHLISIAWIKSNYEEINSHKFFRVASESKEKILFVIRCNFYKDSLPDVVKGSMLCVDVDNEYEPTLVWKDEFYKHSYCHLIAVLNDPSDSIRKLFAGKQIPFSLELDDSPHTLSI